MSEAFLRNEHEAARRLGLSVATMRRRRLLKLPPRWAKLGGRVLYREVDLDAFVEANLVPVTVTKSGNVSLDRQRGHRGK